MKKHVVIIGSGFAGMSAAAFMAQAGWQVTVLEKHATPGGRARQLCEAGFTFDMGPSWYWMPDVFERFFGRFQKKVSDYYQLTRLDPSYRVYFPDGQMDIPADYTSLQQLFESIEPGAAKKLDLFLKEAAFKYETGMQKLVFKPGRSITEFVDIDIMKGLLRLDVLQSMKAHVAKYFQHPKLREIMEFPVLFLGALPEKTPALYSLMNYADIKGGTWYPEGGMYSIVKAMHALALELGVQFVFDTEVTALEVSGNKIKQVHAANKSGELLNWKPDAVISGADYHHTETDLLHKEFQSYKPAYWEKRTMAPSCLLYYVGLNKRLHNIQHHSLFFDASFEAHGKDIYETPRWPDDPLFYMCAASVTDNTIAPEGSENLFLLIPVAAGLEGDTQDLRDRYFELIMQRLEKRLGQNVHEAIVYQRSYALQDFKQDYHSFKGNAYGLANTLSQTAVLKPSCKSKKVDNLFYTGQLTVPGPGVPPSLISGEVVAGVVCRQMNKFQ